MASPLLQGTNKSYKTRHLAVLYGAAVKPTLSIHQSVVVYSPSQHLQTYRRVPNEEICNFIVRLKIETVLIATAQLLHDA